MPPVVGAIRWDNWDSNHYAGDDTTHVDRLTAMFPWRIPYWSTQSGGAWSMNEATQAVIDQDILNAWNAGIDFWAIGHACTWGLYTVEYLKTSSNKSKMKFCSIQTAGLQCRIDIMLDWMNDSQYLTVLSGRPVIFLLMPYYDENGGSAATLTALRNAVTGAGHPNPYVIGMDWTASGAAAFADEYGLDAISTYGGGVLHGQGAHPYSDQVAAELAEWTAFKNTGKQSIPTVTTGWDAWYDTGGSPFITPEATPTEIGNHLQSSVNFVAANPSSNLANLLVISAWNEMSENHYLIPNNSLANQVGTGRLDAVMRVLKGVPAPVRTVRVSEGAMVI